MKPPRACSSTGSMRARVLGVVVLCILISESGTASDAESVFVAWGPPYTPSAAAQLMREMSKNSPHAAVLELCRSREGRSVPMLHVSEGERTGRQRYGVWVQARQHAWESGSSWVAHGFAQRN